MYLELTPGQTARQHTGDESVRPAAVDRATGAASSEVSL